MNYKVIWTIDLEAESPQEAAEKALQIHREPESIATVFTVVDPNQREHLIDLTECPKCDWVGQTRDLERCPACGAEL